MASVSAQTHVRRTYGYWLSPTPAQERALELVLWRCQTFYKVALERRRTWWRRGQGKSATYYQQKAELPDLKTACPEFAWAHAHVLQDVILRVERAFQAFFQRIREGKTPGYPRFQSMNRYHSFAFPEYGNGVTLDGGVLSLSKIGRIRIRLHRPFDGTPKAVAISREAEGWYACFSCAEAPTRLLPFTGQETGIDLGLESFAALADGATIQRPCCYRKAEAYLRRSQRQVARRTKGSNRRRKAVVLVAKAHQKVKRQRQDFHHKTALALVHANDTIYHEEVQTANMARNHHLAKSISAVGWSSFLTILAFKAAYAGKQAVAVSPAFTSQACSGCGILVPKGLSVRWHYCPVCGTNLHRDHNAALNILRLGRERSRAGQAPQTST
jgi:putative transposase